MSSVANEIDGKAFDIQEITPEFNQNSDPDLNQENTGQEGVADVQEDSFENSQEQSQQLDGNELSNEQSEINYDLDVSAISYRETIFFKKEQAIITNKA